MKKRLFHYVTTVVLIAAVVMAQIPAALAADSAPTLTSAYDTVTSTLAVSGNLAKNGKEFVTVVIAPQGTPTATAADLANGEVILKTAQTNSNGVFNITIILPDSATKPRYEYTITVADIVKKSMFTTVTPSDIPASAVTSVNSGGVAAINSFVANDATYGLDDGNTAKSDAAIAKYIAAVKPATGYTDETLVDAYMVGEGLSYVDDGTITISEFFDTYSLYLDEDYAAQYEALDEDVQAAMNEAFKNNDAVTSFDKTYENNLFVAEYVTAESAAELKQVITDYMTANGISQAEHDSINNDVYEEKVYDELFVTRATLKTFDAILAAYNLEVAEQKAAAGQISNDQGGAQPSGRDDRGGVSGSYTPATSVPVASFTDMAGHWSKVYVDEMYARGVVNGFTDGTFKPDNNVTRAEFAKMIAQILGLNVYGGSTFTDVAPDSWYNGYVAAVEKAGIVTGTDGKFMPNSYITRQDAAVMLARVLTYKGKLLQTGSYGFDDEAAIADYAKDSVNAMAKLGLITGYDGGFAPKDNTTRGQAAALLMRVADYIK